MNGDEVTVTDIYELVDERDKKIQAMVALNNGQSVPLDELTAIHGWASTVHKAQGSEYQAVVFVAHTRYELT